MRCVLSRQLTGTGSVTTTRTDRLNGMEGNRCEEVAGQGPKVGMRKEHTKKKGSCYQQNKQVFNQAAGDRCAMIGDELD